MEPGEITVSFSLLMDRLGAPSSRGVRVMYAALENVPKQRTAYLLWMCTSVDQSDCPDNCYAANSLPYETVVFSVEAFPTETWLLRACRRHAHLFSEQPTDDAPST
jgi:shikimate 5-dehydrogenase